MIEKKQRGDGNEGNGNDENYDMNTIRQLGHLLLTARNEPKKVHSQGSSATSFEQQLNEGVSISPSSNLLEGSPVAGSCFLVIFSGLVENDSLGRGDSEGEEMPMERSKRGE